METLHSGALHYEMGLFCVPMTAVLCPCGTQVLARGDRGVGGAAAARKLGMHASARMTGQSGRHASGNKVQMWSCNASRGTNASMRHTRIRCSAADSTECGWHRGSMHHGSSAACSTAAGRAQSASASPVACMQQPQCLATAPSARFRCWKQHISHPGAALVAQAAAAPYASGPSVTSSAAVVPSRGQAPYFIRNWAPWPSASELGLVAHDLAGRPEVDVIVAGAGPAGVAVAGRVAAAGLRVCVVDPDPAAPWPNNVSARLWCLCLQCSRLATATCIHALHVARHAQYGVWVDEFQSMGVLYMGVRALSPARLWTAATAMTCLSLRTPCRPRGLLASGVAQSQGLAGKCARGRKVSVVPCKPGALLLSHCSHVAMQVFKSTLWASRQASVEAQTTQQVCFCR